MDWRAMSRSRSRISMDWRPTSRSRSRPPEATATFDHHGVLTSASYDTGRFMYPNPHIIQDPMKSPDKVAFNRLSKAGTSTSPNIPIPGASPSSAPFVRRSPTHHLSHHPSQPELPSVCEDQAEATGSLPSDLSAINSPVFAPSSLPSSSLHGLTRVPSAPFGEQLSPAERRSFPRHVRKTSFDHTVSKDGILTGLNGRHQVNGRPLASPHVAIGTKRRAETPHHESMLRADPSNFDRSLPVSQLNDPDHLGDGGSSFPTSAFNFSFPPYEGLFSLPTTASSSPIGRQGIYITQVNGQYPHQLGPSSMPTQPYASGSTEGLSAAAAAASAVMAESYARLNTTNLASGDDMLDYTQFLSLMYPGIDGSGSIGGRDSYTHVDPAQILSTGQGDNGPGGNMHGHPAFHASPSSDGWNGVGSGSNDSPEPNSLSNASTPPSAEGPAQNGQGSRWMVGGRKYVPLKQEALQRKGSSAPGNGNSPSELRSSSSTPDLTGFEKGSGEEAEQPPTLCTNCGTTNTPLWRRDPEGQPLCEYSLQCSRRRDIHVFWAPGNACGLFYVRRACRILFVMILRAL